MFFLLFVILKVVPLYLLCCTCWRTGHKESQSPYETHLSGSISNSTWSQTHKRNYLYDSKTSRCPLTEAAKALMTSPNKAMPQRHFHSNSSSEAHDLSNNREACKTHFPTNTPHLIIYGKSFALTPLTTEQDKSGKGTVESAKELVIQTFDMNVRFEVIHANKV